MSAPDPDQDTAYYKRVLHDLIDMGADLARMVHAEAKRHTEAETAVLPPLPDVADDRFPDPTVAFDRIARAIRRTILLAQKLDEPRKEHSRRSSSQPAQNPIAARKQILRAVQNEIHREAKTADKAALNAELLDRLDAPDLEDDLETQSVDRIIIDICRDLHIARPLPAYWKRRTPKDIEALRRRAHALPPSWTKSRKMDEENPGGQDHHPAPRPDIARYDTG